MKTPTLEEFAAMQEAFLKWAATAARAREAEELNTIIGNAEKAFGEHYPVLKHQPLARQVDHILSRLERVRELMMENDKLKIDLAQARRENETMARQVPPVPRDHPSVMDIEEAMKFSGGLFPADMGVTSSSAFTKVIGQAWCRTDGRPPDGSIVGYTEGMVLCNVHQDVATGALAYVPISFDDLPRVTEAAAS
jgi:hypothetical protein